MSLKLTRPGGRPLLPSLLLSLCLAALSLATAQNPPPTQVFYIPFSEDDQLAGFDAINPVAGNPLAVFVTFSTVADDTVIYYDHWEDGYETDITNPVQATTRIYGDGDPSNGYPPGNAGDLIAAGTVFDLRNFVETATPGDVVDFDARDKVASFKPISLTKTCFPAGTNTLLAGCVEIFEHGLWGTEYRVPVGEDMPTSTASGNLTFDEDCFSYVAVSISAGREGASVQVDKDNDGTFEESVVLAEGETAYYEGIDTGARILSDHPVQAVLFTGTVGSNYASRDTMLLPTYRWASDYYAPVTTGAGGGTVTFLYNPGASPITVSYDYRDSASSYVTGTVSVPAGGNARVVMSEGNGSTHFGAYRFYTTGADPAGFYAVSTIDADDASGSNQAWDGGFTLVGRPSLTTQALVSLGIGRDPYSDVNPTENGNPVWATTVGNGDTPARVYVDYNGDNAGSLTDPNGNHYDVHYDVRELVQLKLFDPDGNQSGMLIYTLDPTVRIAAVWGQDPAIAQGGQPGLDVAALVPPLREGASGKQALLGDDVDGDGQISAGDVLDYRIRTVNTARTSIPGPFTVTDNLPADVTYVPGTTRCRYRVGGVWQGWISLPDDGSGTAFPLDGAGYAIMGSLGIGDEIEVSFEAAVSPTPVSGSLVNTGEVEISPYGLVIPIESEDILYGTLGDRVWNDIDGDGVQDAGEPGLNGITVWADLDGNGTPDPGEPSDVTDGDGDYLLTGLTGGTYVVRVSPAEIAALDPRFGPSDDLDGTTTPHEATAALAAAGDRTDVDFGYKIGASVGDRVWADFDGDGVQEAGEPGINGVRVYLDLNGNDSFDSGEPFSVTFGDGNYFIGNLDPGSYQVRVDSSTLPGGATQTHDLNGGLDHEGSVSLSGVEHRDDLDFGYRGSLSIGDLVWEDLNGDGLVGEGFDVINGRFDMNRSGGVGSADDGFLGGYEIIDGSVDITGNGSISNWDDGFIFGYQVINGEVDVNGSGSVTDSDDLDGAVPGEAGIPGVRVYLDSNDNGTFDSNEPSAITDADGLYSIGNLFNGDYRVRVDAGTLPASYVQTYDLTDPVDDATAEVTLSGSSRTDADFGYRNDATIGDLVWNDRNGDGVRDPGEPGIEGVLVYIDADNNNRFDQGVETLTYTDIDGFYRFDNLAEGTYSVRVEISTLPQGASQTYDLNGGLDHEAGRTLAVSEDAVDVDFGYTANASFGDFVWTDTDGDGVQDGGEPGISGVTVYLDINGNGVFDPASEPSDVTDGSGAYSIGNLVPGVYTARVDPAGLPANSAPTYDLSGTLDNAATFSLSANQARTDVDFGYAAGAAIGDFVWEDSDGDGVQDSGEPGLGGVEVTLFNAAGDSVVATTTTAGDGSYDFSGLVPGAYYLGFASVPGYERTSADQGADSADSDAVAATGRTADFVLISGETNNTLDAGYYQTGSIGDFVWEDLDVDGVQDAGEVGLENVEVDLFRPGFGPDGIPGNSDDDDPLATTTSGVDGAYGFSGLVPGDYVVGFAAVGGHLRSPEGAGSADTDSDAGTDGATAAVTVLSGQDITDIDAGYVPAGAISGTVRLDIDNDNLPEQPLAGVTVTLKDASGDDIDSDPGTPGVQPTTAVTNVDGEYTFGGLLPGDYRVVESDPSGFISVSDVDGANNNVVGDETPITVVAGGVNAGNDFLDEQLNTISGSVLADTTGNGSGDSGIPGVVITLTDGAGIPIDGDPGTPGTQPITAVTNGSGAYLFTGVPPGVYGVAEAQPAGYATIADGDTTSPADDAANADTTDDFVPVSVFNGENDTGNDFVEVELGAISGHVFVGSDPLSGVTLTLLDEFGDPVDGDPGTPGVQPITTTTGGDGSYRFANVPPGTYQVGQTQPQGYDSFGDVDGGDLDIIGDVTPITIAPGEESEDNDFVETLDTCPDDWDEWLYQHPGEWADGNPDLDIYDNLAEFAFAMPALDGSGSPWLDRTAWIIQPSTLVPGTIEGVFIRPTGALLDVTYTLEYAASLGDPVVWQSLTLQPSHYTTVNNGDCTETVTIHDLENLTGLTGGDGVVRLRVDLDEEPDTVIDHTSYSEVEGWTEAGLPLCCVSYNDPYQRETLFTGMVGSVSGQDLVFTLSGGSFDLGTLLVPGASYYIEVNSGDLEGHRFDVASATGNTLTLANDSDLHAAVAPFNTLTGAPPATLAGDVVMLRRHTTLDEHFPPSSFGATGSQTTADEVQVFAEGGWTSYWLYDDAGSPRWVEVTDGSMADQGGLVIPPGQGVFFYNRTAATTVLQYGEIRNNDFVRPLMDGDNLVGGGFPLDQSATGSAGRAMDTGFTGTLDFKTADSFYIWRKDSEGPSARGYHSHFRVDGNPFNPSLLRWAQVGDSVLTERGNDTLFLRSRGVFLRSQAGFDGYTMPSPWAPDGP